MQVLKHTEIKSMNQLDVLRHIDVKLSKFVDSMNKVAHNINPETEN